MLSHTRVSWKLQDLHSAHEEFAALEQRLCPEGYESQLCQRLCWSEFMLSTYQQLQSLKSTHRWVLELSRSPSCIPLSWEFLFINLRLLLLETKKEIMRSMQPVSCFFSFLCHFKKNKKSFLFFFSLWLLLLYVNSLCRLKFLDCQDTVPQEQRKNGQWPHSETRMTEGCMLVCLVAGFETTTMILFTYSLSRAR